MSASQEYIEVACETAREFLRELSPLAEWFNWGSWIFRGHADASWDLVPSAFRDGARLFRGYEHTRGWHEWTNADQIQAEAATLRAFASASDHAGLPIPLDSPAFKEALVAPFKTWFGNGMESGNFAWPPPVLWPALALAQHHGVPTRLLDWSDSSHIAAYFAAVGVASSSIESCRLAVWAYCDSAQGAYYGTEGPLQLLPNDRLAVVRTPYASNSNLRAQRGVHLAMPLSKVPWLGPANRSPFQERLLDVHRFGATMLKMVGAIGALIRFTLPSSEAGVLLGLLAKHGVAGSELFTGYDGVVRGLWEGTLYRPKRDQSPS